MRWKRGRGREKDKGRKENGYNRRHINNFMKNNIHITWIPEERHKDQNSSLKK